MPLVGTLKTMPVSDLLQWLGTSRKTGTLRFERDKVSKLILMQDGLIVGCSSDDPPERLGHFLLARGRITEEQLREALDLQELSGKYLGLMLVEMGALTTEELTADLEAKADETIYSLFEWDEAVFKFVEELSEHSSVFPVNLRVEDVLLRGLKRYDEIRRIREVFNDPGIILGRTKKQPPRDVLEDQMARSIYDAINGERTVAGILLHVHGSEYAVTNFLYELKEHGFVEITGIKQTAGTSGAAVRPAARPAPGPSPRGTSGVSASGTTATGGVSAPPAGTAAAATDPQAATATLDPPATPAGAEIGPADEVDELLSDWIESDEIDRPEVEGSVAAESPAGSDVETGEAVTEPAEAPGDSAPDGPGGVEPLDVSPAHVLGRELEKARELMNRNEFEGALELLDAVYKQFPGDDSLRRLTAEAEAAFIDKAYRHFLPPTKIPVLTQPMEQLESQKISPTEFFLLSRIDGTWNVKSIIQIAPLRESDALRTLKRMREDGVIELQDPE